VIVPEDCTVCEEVRTPAVSIVRNSPVIANATVTPNGTLRIAIHFTIVIAKADIVSINKHYCPGEQHKYKKKNPKNSPKFHDKAPKRLRKPF
jgi:hypothetical protein